MGLGPKGLYCLERLAAEFNARPLDEPLVVHVFDRSPHFGASPIYAPEQPDHILVNISVGEIDLWTATDPPPAGGRGPNFLTWYRQTFNETLTGEEYLPRSVVGRYLIEGFRHIVDRLPDGMSVVRHTSEVMDVEPVPDGYRIGDIHVEKILLATGHSRVVPNETESAYAAFANGTFIPFVYPVVETMRAIEPGARVAMLGIGLTFIDAVVELTEGRGGRFIPVGGQAPRLSYEKSGNEPAVIFPFSRTGLPMTPKAVDLPPAPRRLQFATREVLSRLRRERGQLDFERDILPLFEQELEEHHPGFDYRRYVDPVGEQRFASGAEFNAFIDSYMDEELARARRGHAGCSIKRAIDIWYEVRKTIGECLSFGGLTPESHRALFEDYSPRFKRVVFGPPVINNEKILALVRGGLIDFSVSRSPRIVMNDDFELRCELNDSVAHAEVLVDARYPRTDVARDASPLYRSLYRRGMIRAFRNQSYAPGAIDMTQGTRFVIDAHGNVNEDICVIGIPTEGNLVGNLTIGRDPYAAAWAEGVMSQMVRRHAPRSAAATLPP